MSHYVFGFQDIDKTKLPIAGGKGANLGELFKIEGIRVPDGFCLSAEAFKRIIAQNSSINDLLDRLGLLKAEERDKIYELSAEIRKLIEGIPMQEEIKEEITSSLNTLGEKHAYAVRSSATAEDLPAASFAGQQDTYLNIIGKESILKHISKCWASLFTDRAVTYRIQNGFGHRNVQLAVIVQKMIFPQASGILFTSDPVTSNRKVSSIDAGFGLGEALVSGLVNPDIYKVRSGKIIDKKVPGKKLAVYALKDGGTKKHLIEPGKQNKQMLEDDQILELEQIGRRIEKHFGCPQDIEWCLAENIFYILQSRPITALFPIPEANDPGNHVYVSVGHQQMMTDAMKPLGISLWKLTAARQMFAAGGRLFVDVTDQLASPEKREILLNIMGQHDPLMKDALVTIIERGDFIKSLPYENSFRKSNLDRPPLDFQTLNDYEPAVVNDLINRYGTSVEELKDNIQTKSGSDLFDFILEDIRQLKKILVDPRNMGVIMTAMNASSWINEKMNEWLGEINAADILSQSVPNNITSEMGRALLDAADVIRPYPEVIEYLYHSKGDNFLDKLADLNGGKEASNAIYSFLNKYGMRCSGEIDITKDRWSEKPAALVPLILSNIKNFEPGESNRRFEHARQEALNKEEELLDRLKQLPDGEAKVKETKRMIGLIRNLSGYREYPKYFMINRYFIYKKAILQEAGRLLRAGLIHEKEDIYYLTFEELHELVRQAVHLAAEEQNGEAKMNKPDYQIIMKRKDEYKLYEKLTPPRVITSEGEIINGKYKRENLPPDALIGLPVSSGVIEGRARVILKIEDANLEDGDILVTTFTDPSWTPLFVSVKGLVTEVGGLNTHGAVIAREYGLPAVVGVENAVKLIKEGERIRVNGTAGYVEILY